MTLPRNVFPIEKPIQEIVKPRLHWAKAEIDATPKTTRTMISAKLSTWLARSIHTRRSFVSTYWIISTKEQATAQSVSALSKNSTLGKPASDLQIVMNKTTGRPGGYLVV